jgi:hypothetical protein
LSGSKSSYIISLSQSGFLLRILWCIQNGDHPENNLAKFGYRLDMKVEKKNRILLCSWLRMRTYHKNLAIWIYFCSKSSEFGPNFPWKILCIGRNHIFQFEDSPVKETLIPSWSQLQ